ncbi:MAG TPA: tetratricopeptide repeat protein [Gaiellaceae bacterium]|nr:tetratricopeptide repeat protein [Gaiellaceae bacterium]
MAWQLLRERSPRGERLRRRVAVLVGAGVFFGGLLIAIGLGVLLLIVAVAVLIAAVVGAAAWGATRVETPKPDLQRIGHGARTGIDRARVAGTRVARDLQPVVSGFVERATTRARTVDWGGWPYAGGQEPTAQVAPADQHRRAVQLNAQGAQLRSEGRPEEAAERHRQALAIFRRLGDRRAEAPTLNSLALALDASGDTEAAVERFEQALAILRDLHDEPHEGKVIANLGFTMLRHGDDDRARGLLETALDKLDPESRAAQQVVEQLQRAS